jgi:hypothetical protein
MVALQRQSGNRVRDGDRYRAPCQSLGTEVWLRKRWIYRMLRRTRDHFATLPHSGGAVALTPNATTTTDAAGIHAPAYVSAAYENLRTARKSSAYSYRWPRYLGRRAKTGHSP